MAGRLKQTHVGVVSHTVNGKNGAVVDMCMCMCKTVCVCLSVCVCVSMRVCMHLPLDVWMFVRVGVHEVLGCVGSVGVGGVCGGACGCVCMGNMCGGGGE